MAWDSGRELVAVVQAWHQMSAFEKGAQSARWAVEKGRVEQPEELAARVRVGHVSQEFAAGYAAVVAEAEAAGAMISHTAAVVA